MVDVPSQPRSRRRAMILAVPAVVLALALGGCGGGQHAHPTTATTATTSSSGHSGSATATTTTTSTTTPALAGTDRPAVTIGDKNYVEQFVLGQLYKKALQAQGYQVTLSPNIGPPDVVRLALQKGTLAMYPEYLYVFAQTVAGIRRPLHSQRAVYAVSEGWARRHGLRLLTPTPFSDTYAIAVTDAYASQHALSTIADLRHVNRAFLLGGAVQFKVFPDGLHALKTVYGVTPQSFHAIAVGDQYADLDTGELQAAYVNTTDGQLVSGDYRLLDDPDHIFGFGNVVPVVSHSALVKEGPVFAETIERVDRFLTLPVMRALNDQANNQSPSSVATQFLQTHGLLTPLPVNGTTAVAGGSGGSGDSGG